MNTADQEIHQPHEISASQVLDPNIEARQAVGRIDSSQTSGLLTRCEERLTGFAYDKTGSTKYGLAKYGTERRLHPPSIPVPIPLI